MNMCVHGQTKKQVKDIAYIVVRSDNVPVAVHAYREDADDMADSYTQDMRDRSIPDIVFKVSAIPFYGL